MNNEELADAFEEQRSRLLAVAYRVLGSRTDAEDAVQEAWLRLSRQDVESIGNLKGWLTTVVGRICIDTIRSRAGRDEVSIDQGVPDFEVTEDPDTPENSAVLADSVGLALLVVLGSLSADERLSFVLHDLFGVPFAEVGDILGKSTDATKMLASRARRKVRDTPEPSGSKREQRKVVDAFLTAAREGDFDGLLRVLDPNVVWERHTIRGVSTGTGTAGVLEAVRRGQGSGVITRRVQVNGQPGILAWGPTGKPISVMACTVEDGRMVGIVSVLDPARLAKMDLPAASPEAR